MRNRSQIIQRKLERLHNGAAPRVLDLFSGAGGLMLGFQLAGCESVVGVESDPLAARTYAQAFHKHARPELFELHARHRDITNTDPQGLMREFGFQKPLDAVDFLIGGPPCPTFTRVGRAKLREVHDHPEAFKIDERAHLYLPYLKFVERLSPVAILMENVPDFLNWGGHNLGEEVAEILEELGYHCAYTLLNAANYWVPQMRDRFYLIAIHRSAEADIRFPEPLCRVDFPPGYRSSRQVALRAVPDRGLFHPAPRYTTSPSDRGALHPAVTVAEAIGDLPPITGHLDGSIKRGARRFDLPINYSNGAGSKYSDFMRSWPGFEAREALCDHVTRSLSERDYRIFRGMLPGDDYPRAHSLAVRLFEEELERLSKQNRIPAEGSPDYRRLKADFVPPYDPTKFPNRWRKMEADKPARTLMAHLGKDSYTHIHYDSDQCRVLSVREAARLQSFPDGFVFAGTMNPAFRQIGNAVPPVMAAFLAEEIRSSLGLQRVFTTGRSCLPPKRAKSLRAMASSPR